MDNTEYDTKSTAADEVGVVAGVVQMDENRQPIQETFTPLICTRFEHMPFGRVAYESFLMPPIEPDSVYKWLAEQLRDMADDLEKRAQERR